MDCHCCIRLVRDSCGSSLWSWSWPLLSSVWCNPGSSLWLICQSWWLSSLCDVSNGLVGIETALWCKGCTKTAWEHCNAPPVLDLSGFWEGKRQQPGIKGCCKAPCPWTAPWQKSTEAGDADLFWSSSDVDHFALFLTAAGWEQAFNKSSHWMTAITEGHALNNFMLCGMCKYFLTYQLNSTNCCLGVPTPGEECSITQLLKTAVNKIGGVNTVAQMWHTPLYSSFSL